MFVNKADLCIAVKITAGPVGIVRPKTGILTGHAGPAVFSGRGKLEKPIAVRGAIVDLRIPAGKDIVTLPAPGIKLRFKLKVSQDTGNRAQAPAASGQDKIDLFGVLLGLGAAVAIAAGRFCMPAHSNLTTASMAARRASSAAGSSPASDSVYFFQAAAVMKSRSTGPEIPST